MGIEKAKALLAATMVPGADVDWLLPGRKGRELLAWAIGAAEALKKAPCRCISDGPASTAPYECDGCKALANFEKLFPEVVG